MWNNKRIVMLELSLAWNLKDFEVKHFTTRNIIIIIIRIVANNTNNKHSKSFLMKNSFSTAYKTDTCKL